MTSLIRRATQVAVAFTIALGALGASADSASAVVFCEKVNAAGKSKIKVRSVGCKKNEDRITDEGDPTTLARQVQADLEDLMSRIANPEVFELGVEFAESLDALSVSIPNKDHCSLTRMSLTVNDASGRFRWCEVTTDGNGQWTLSGRAAVGTGIYCQAVCF